MAEVLGVIGSLAGILNFTFTAINCINSWSGKSEKVRKLGRQLESQHKELSRLRDFCELNSENLPALRSLNESGDIFDQTNTTLKNLVKMLTDARGEKKSVDWAKRGRAMLVWPMLEKELEAALTCLERFKSSLSIALEQDTLCAPLSLLIPRAEI